jgi:hypothetical protein
MALGVVKMVSRTGGREFGDVAKSMRRCHGNTQSEKRKVEPLHTLHAI